MRTPSGLFSPYAIAGLCLALGLVACGDSLILPPDGQPATITVKDGDDQRGRVREPLREPLVVQVTDARGRAVQGATVAFELTSAGSEVVPAEKRTDADGLADARLVLGTTIGRQTGRARVVTPQGSPPVQADFSAMALSEDANSMAVVAGQDQAGHVGAPLDDRLVVEVTDGFGNPVEGVPIDWVAEGGGSVSDAVVVTDESGRARVERTLGPTVGTQTTLASSEGLAGSPVTFVHTALAGNASRLVVVSGSGQTAAAGSVLPADLVVRLVDAEGNGVPQTAVSWVVATGGGNANPENSTTDGEGRASARWTLGGVLGEQRLDAVVSGVGVASFRATATAGAPASLVITTQPSASAGNGAPFERQPVIQVRDARGNDVSAAGIQVSVVIGSGGGELSGTSQRNTDPAGRATFTGLAISGAAGKRTLFFSAPGYAGVTSNEIDIAAAPQNQQPSAVFTVECNELRCSFDSDGSIDPDGRIVSRQWSFGDGATSDSRRPTHTYSTGGTYQVALTVTDDDEATGSTSRAVTVGKAPDADFNWHCEDLTCHFTDASEDDDGTIASRNWNFGDGSSVQNELSPSHTYSAPGEYTVVLTVTDNGGLTDEATDEVDPEAPPPQNQPPTATFTWQCDDLECDFDGESGDIDGEIESREWSFGDGGTSDDANPSHQYAAEGTYTVRFTVTDDDGATGFVEHSVAVNEPNAPPQAQGDSYTTDEDTPLSVVAPGVLVNDTDPNGDALTAVKLSDPPNGTVTLGSTGSFDYTPAANFSGTDSFTYQASDGSLLSGEVTVTITVAPVNDPPVVGSDAYTTLGLGQPLTVSAPGVLQNDSDPEGALLTAGNASSPVQGTVILGSDGSFTYTPNLGASGTDSFTYDASDGPLSSTGTVAISIP